MRRAILGLPLLLVAAFGCGGESDYESTDIVENIPWTAPEEQAYRVLDDDDDEVGTALLSLEEVGDELLIRQSFEFPDAGFTNEAELRVDAETLQPKVVSYEIDGPEGAAVCDGDYDVTRVHVLNTREDGEKEDTLALPEIAYDSWSDLFLWRTIDFSEGYTAEYTDVSACQAPAAPIRLSAIVEVKDQEEISVPAGTFETRLVEVDVGGATHKVWYTNDDERRLIKYENENVTFELIEPPA